MSSVVSHDNSLQNGRSYLSPEGPRAQTMMSSGPTHYPQPMRTSGPEPPVATKAWNANGLQIVNACWESGCDGTKFSSFSNLLRHQREQHGEKHGESAKATCNLCGLEFTRTTARNVHQENRVCLKPKE
jgi:hypothetical protein